jgi:hypothetical protein
MPYMIVGIVILPPNTSSYVHGITASLSFHVVDPSGLFSEVFLPSPSGSVKIKKRSKNELNGLI